MAKFEMQGRSGRRFYPGDLTPDTVNIRDIASALSKVCRFGGHCVEFFSVAEHSLVVSDICFRHTGDYNLALQGLLHDVQEAYVGDFPTPLKQSYPLLSDVQDKAWRACATALGMPYKLHPVVKVADLECLTLEVRQNMAKPVDVDWGNLKEPAFDIHLQFHGPAKSERKFLRRYRYLKERIAVG